MKIIPLLFFLSFINAQIALPTFQAVHKPHPTTSSGTFTFTNSDATGKDSPHLKKMIIDTMMRKMKDGWNAQNQGNDNPQSMTQIGE